ncbi:MAG: OsmC family protein [Thermodesulfobacteriota bacterium]
MVDLPGPLGGTNKAPNPTQFILGALASCAEAFIKDTLAPLIGVSVDAVEVEARCQAELGGLLGIECMITPINSFEDTHPHF